MTSMSRRRLRYYDVVMADDVDTRRWRPQHRRWRRRRHLNAGQSPNEE